MESSQLTPASTPILGQPTQPQSHRFEMLFVLVSADNCLYVHHGLIPVLTTLHIFLMEQLL